MSFPFLSVLVFTLTGLEVGRSGGVLHSVFVGRLGSLYPRLFFAITLKEYQPQGDKVMKAVLDFLSRYSISSSAEFQ